MIKRKKSRPNPRKTGDYWDLNHRWRRVVYLVDEGKQPSKTRDDAIIRQSCKFLRALRRSQKEDFRSPMPYHFPAIAGVYDCYRYLTPLQQTEIKARLLAGQTNVAIADRCTIPAKVVRVFHDLFYDVRPRLGDSSFIARMALGWWPQPDDADLLGALKLFGYSLGGRAVDALLYYIISSLDAGVCAGGSSALESDKARWERLLEQTSRTSNSLVRNETPDRLLSLVTLLREKGASLVAESVEVPVPPPPKLPPVSSMGMRAWAEWAAPDIDEEEMLPLADEEDD